MTASDEIENLEPNLETVKAIEVTKKGIGLSRGFDSVYELMKDLDSED